MKVEADAFESMASGDEGDSDGLLAGFLFGNIDERGELEDDFIDDVSAMYNSLVLWKPTKLIVRCRCSVKFPQHDCTN